MRDNLDQLTGLEISDGVYLWSGEIIRGQFPQEKHPDTDLVVTTNDGKSVGFNDISDLAEELELQVDQSWPSEATSIQVGEYRIVQQASTFLVAKVDLSDVGELWGDVEDYYPDEELDEERLYAWKRSRILWTQAVKALDFVRASSVEMEWGDSPLTRRILQEINLEEEL